METEIRNALLDAELNEHYYRRRAKRAERVDRGMRMVSLVASFGAVVAALGTGDEVLVAAAAAASAVAGVAGLAAGYGELATRRRELAIMWTRLHGKLRAAVRDGSRDLIVEALAEREELETEDVEPRDDRLARSIQDAMVGKLAT